MFGGKPKRRQPPQTRHSKTQGTGKHDAADQQQASQVNGTAGVVLNSRHKLPKPIPSHPQSLLPSHMPPVAPRNIPMIPPRPAQPTKASNINLGLGHCNGDRSLKQIIGPFIGQSHVRTIEERAQGALCDLLSSKLDSILTSIDGEAFAGDEKELVIHEGPHTGLRGGWGSKDRGASKGVNKAISSAIIGTNYFAKANLYANSKLPPNLPPLNLYLPSYPLLCLAAQYSQRAYNKPSGAEREAFVNADWRLGTKAMVIKSLPIDHMNCVVFAIRGSQTFMDWAVNLNSAPVSPFEFLDDPGNLCHSGFLSVARKMIKPVAARLRSLLEEDPSRSTCSLLMTGHSAGGAVASLLYAHMLAENARSELNILTGCFKRIHCITFGAPPLSLLPLAKPRSLRHKKSLFLSFINEGDPVPRADKAYIRSLLHLYASPAPGSTPAGPAPLALPTIKPCRRPPHCKKPASAPIVLQARDWIWEVPPGALSNAGRLVVLRGSGGANAVAAEEDVKAEITSDQQLRGVVFGDPVMHMMKVYARRVEILGVRAVTGRIWN